MHRRLGQRLRWLLLLCLPAVAGALELPADAQRALIHPGAWSFRIRRAAGPQAIDGFVWERGAANLSLRASVGGGQVNALEGTSRQVARLTTPERRPIAAVNGDFYAMRGPGQGGTSGVFIREGELLSMGFGRPAVAVLADGSPWIGTVTNSLELRRDQGEPLKITRLNHERGPDHLVLYSPAWGRTTGTNDSGAEVVLTGAGRVYPRFSAGLEVAGPARRGSQPIPADGLVLSGHGRWADVVRSLKPGEKLQFVTTTEPDLPLTSAVGGGPILLAGGQRVYQPKPQEPRHPRTAIGFDDQQLVAVTVDGRRTGYAAGMTLPELAELMREFGCREALNLDGGGSTTCWIRGRVVNRPSDGRERSVANALALMSEGVLGAPAAIVLDPPGPLVLAPGARVPIRTTVTDALLNPLEARGTATLTVEGDVGRWDGRELVAGDRAAAGRLVARAGDLTAAVPVDVVTRIATLRVEPAAIEVLPGQALPLRVAGADQAGRAVVLAPAGIAWTVAAEVGAVTDGELIGGREGAAGTLRCEAGGAAAEVPVKVAGAVVVEDFEQGAGGKLALVPATATGSLDHATGDAPSGQGFARLVYHLGEEAVTRAAYLRLDRPIGRALAVRARVRGDGQRVWLRVGLLDGNGLRLTETLHEGVLGTEWTTVQAVLPAGAKPPLTWESVYLVSLANHTTRDGLVDWDRLEVLKP